MYLTSSFSRVRYASVFSMSPFEAIRELGVQGTGDFQKDKSLLRGLVRRYHPDVSQEKDAKKKMQAANVLWETYIRDGQSLPIAGEQNRGAPSSFGGDHARPDDLPEWQTDERSTYNTVGGPLNINYNKKRIYDVSLDAEGGDRSKLRRMTVWAFDGMFSRGVFTVFGSDKVYPEMARCMRIWNNGHTEAVLVSEDGEVKIIWIKGHDVDIPVEHESSNLNPFNDQEFVRNLRKFIVEY
jgi:hypothetical protein